MPEPKITPNEYYERDIIYKLETARGALSNSLISFRGLKKSSKFKSSEQSINDLIAGIDKIFHRAFDIRQ